MLKLDRPANPDAVFTQPPSGGCVLKLNFLLFSFRLCLPAAFGRLCVETGLSHHLIDWNKTSRLRAAVC